MSLYRFRIGHGARAPTEDSAELAGLAEAQAVALRFAGEKLKEQDISFWDEGEWYLTVLNEEGLTLFSVTVFATLAPSLRARR